MSNNNQEQFEILIRSIDDEIVKNIFDNIKNIFKNEIVKEEYLTGPDIKIDNINERDLEGEHIIQKANLYIKSIYNKNNNSNFEFQVLIFHFHRNPLSSSLQNSPWVNSFSFEKPYFSPHNNEAHRAFSDWVNKKENKDKIISSIKFINDATISPSSDLDNNDYKISTIIAAMKDSHLRIMADYQKRLDEVEKYNQKREEIYTKKDIDRESKYKEKLDCIEKEREELNRQSHKSERRKLFSKVTDAEQLSKRKKSLSLESRIIRWGIVMVSIFCASICFYITISCIDSLNYAAISPKEINWVYEYLIFKSVASSAVAVASLVFAARWMQSFYKEDVKRSEDVERFNADMIRASWAIETILEVQEEYKKEVPEVLIKGMITGLFEDKQKANEVNDASLALQALLAFTGSASFGPNGPTIQIGKKEAKALSKAKPSTDEEK